MKEMEEVKDGNGSWERIEKISTHIILRERKGNTGNFGSE